MRQLDADLGSAERPLLVALTGHGLPGDLERSHEAGFDAHLVKPVELAELEAGLRRARSRGGAQVRAAG